MSGLTVFWILVLGLLDAFAVFMITRYGVRHGEPTPGKPEESRAVTSLRNANAERLAKIEAARSRTALPSGEPQRS